MEDQDSFTQEVIGAAIDVHRALGPGLLESVYQVCLEHELRLRGIEHQPQKLLPITYKGLQLDADLRMDFYFPERLVAELKAVEKLLPIHEAQLLTYLRLTKVRVGLLINFCVPALKDGIKRLIL